MKITTLPTAGALLLEGEDVAAGTFVRATDLANGDLVFVPGADENGWNSARFTFQVQEDGGLAAGGRNLDPTPNVLRVDVTPVDDPSPAAAELTLVGVSDNPAMPSPIDPAWM